MDVLSADEAVGTVEHNLAEAMYAVNRAMSEVSDNEFVFESILFIREQIVMVRQHLDPELVL